MKKKLFLLIALLLVCRVAYPMQDEERSFSSGAVTPESDPGRKNNRAISIHSADDESVHTVSKETSPTSKDIEIQKLLDFKARVDAEILRRQALNQMPPSGSFSSKAQLGTPQVQASQVAAASYPVQTDCAAASHYVAVAYEENDEIYESHK
ncbi:MAG: hypothetical protein P4L31_07010 [Candidatus Babeliales bacterium]|nr:hypothetical protein [Candidatus Babeliales bacterium]